MKTTHTPGPWMRSLAYEAKEKRPPYNVWTIIGNADADERRHSVVATTITDDQDARLIAAAPELLEACKGICQAVSDCLPISGEGEVDVLYYKSKLLAIDQAAAICSQAISKAEGN